jgi:hypothetical protein
MRLAAERVLAALPPAAREKVARPFDDKDRLDWHYTPRSRNGVALKELDPQGRDAVHALLKEALSATGYQKAVNIIELELVLREMETFGGLMRDPERYHLTIYGTPSKTAAWGWRFEGHHLSLNFALAGDHMAVDTPSFFGANPANVPRGPKAGQRVLAAEEDEARALLTSLSEAQRRDAVFDTRTFGDIVTGNKEKVEPLQPVGIAAAQLSEAQRAQLLKLIEVYARTFEPGLAEARMARVRDGGIEKVRFGWAGATEKGKQHYYRVQGRSSSSSTTRPRMAATTSTRCGATSTATSAAICCASTTRTSKAPRTSIEVAGGLQQLARPLGADFLGRSGAAGERSTSASAAPLYCCSRW